MHSRYLTYFPRSPIPRTPTSKQEAADNSKQIAIVTSFDIRAGLERSRKLLDLGLIKLILGVRDKGRREAARQSLTLARIHRQTLSRSRRSTSYLIIRQQSLPNGPASFNTSISPS
ncbi:hypothetical protein GGR54DRAFT_435307 [Hypoxylon sp. NC1633]|nr:hypothetical protein GGR54DRAFT_435307 [Hypoxylon sp. NC1633]